MSRFKNKRAELLFKNERVPRFPPDVRDRARDALHLVHSAEGLEDLRALPSLRLKTLGGKRKEEWSIRINDQWRVCFRWTETGATDIEVVDYH